MIFDINKVLARLESGEQIFSDNLSITGSNIDSILEGKMQSQLNALGLLSLGDDYVSNNVNIGDKMMFRSVAVAINDIATKYVEAGTDYGGLAALVRSGEGSWNEYNRGKVANGKKSRNFTNLTIGTVEGFQTLPKSHEDYVFAVGAYQFTPGVLATARQNAKLNPSIELFSPVNQTKMFWALILNGSKRPHLRDYLLGKTDNLKAAWVDIAHEWAALPLPSGKGAYDGDAAGNRASIKVEAIEKALKDARYAISGKR